MMNLTSGRLHVFLNIQASDGVLDLISVHENFINLNLQQVSSKD